MPAYDNFLGLNNNLGGNPYSGYENAILDPNSEYLNNSFTPSNLGASSAPSVPSPFSFAGNIVGTGIGIYEFFRSQQQLNALNKIPYPSYTVSPELRSAYSSAQGIANQGFTAGEKAGYQNNINQQGALSYQRALGQSGGNQSNAISAAINGQGINASGNIAIADANLRRENMKYAGSLAGEIQGQNNLQTQNLVQQRQYNQQVLAQEGSAGLQSILNSLQGGVSSGGGYAGLLKLLTAGAGAAAV